MPGDKGRLAGFLDFAHDAGRLLVEVAHGVDEGFIILDL